MLNRFNRWKETCGVEDGISDIFKSGAVKTVLTGFDRIVFGALAGKLHTGAAGFDLELLDGLNRKSQGDRASLALLNRVGDRNPLDEDLLRKALATVDAAQRVPLPSVTPGNK
jgi:hypothetical protein